MDDGIEKVTNITTPFINSPIQYQQTKHIENLLSSYGAEGQNNIVLRTFKEVLNNPGMRCTNLTINQLIKHYGTQSWRAWFSDIYKWEFKKEIA